jgi:hypothetical protein
LYSLPLPIILLIVNMYRHYSPQSCFSDGRLDRPLSGQVASFILFQPLGEAVLALTSLGMAVPALIPFRMIVASTTICPLSMVALALIPLAVVVLALATTWVTASDSMAFFTTVPLTTRPLGMVMVPF